ncbi:glycosyltransferase [Lichenicola sp.]|uniref:glycosyltransferase n=1 Tax=Lichenicola sp. TaxID=2804529 RepID=UPI003AFFBFB9
MSQAAIAAVDRISIVTRLFDDDQLGCVHGLPCEPFGAKITIDRIATADRHYLEKEGLAADLPAFIDAFCKHLETLPKQADIIHAHFSDAAAVALIARRRFGIPVIYTPHALGIDKRAHRPGSDALDGRIAAEHQAIAMADAIVVSTRDEADRQLRAYGVADATTRTHCVAPGVPHRVRSGPSPSRLDGWDAQLLDPHKPIVLAIARPVRKKNLAALVRAYAGHPALVERANLVILAGQHGSPHASAEEREVIAELERLRTDHGLHGQMALPPRHGPDDVDALYRQAARGGVFVNPALHEPFGLTLIEAAAAGVPVVATCNGGPAEIVGRIGHGILVDPSDDVAIGAACFKIVSDTVRHRALSNAALDNAGFYNWPDYAGKTVALYASLHRSRARSIPADQPAAA